MRGREHPEAAEARWELLKIVQENYKEFSDFLYDGMIALGFKSTEIQEDIGDWLENGPQYLMAQAQRGQAKTTVAALFSVWTLIHQPPARVVIVSAGGTQANEISTLIVRLIMTLEVLECMRPDKLAGDRTATDAFDIHHSLKGLDKSPSVACFGIDSNIQGKRADLLIADDVESGKNSATAVQRAKILHITRDFTSINSTGRIIWLGTPQSIDSIYNSLPGRGVAIRIWPGRYPTPKQLETYGDNLAPLIATRLMLDPSLGMGGGMLGDQGKPIDAIIMSEEALQKKELDQTTAYFQLQHMLSTALVDAARFPLKPSNLVAFVPSSDRRHDHQANYPLKVVRGMQGAALKDFAVHEYGFKMMLPHEMSVETAPFQSVWAYVDPAAGGANADETAYAIGGFLNGNVYLLDVGGVPGGYELEKLRELANILRSWRIDGVTIEKNMGHGAFKAVFQPVLIDKTFQCQLDEELASGQKELRIINILAPVMGRGSLIVDEAIVERDQASTARYSAALRLTYSFFFQLGKLTAARGALIHDDRLDAVAGLVNHWTEALAKDQKNEIARVQAAQHKKLIADPLGYKQYNYGGPKSNPNNLIASRFGRRKR